MYFNLIETIRDIDSRISGIVLLEDRIELENEVNELAISSFLETYGDNEGLFYKVQIEYLISTLDDLYDKIHDLFMKRKPQLKHGVEIDRDELERIVGKEILATALVELEENLKYSSFENLYWEAPTIDFNIEIGRIKLAFSTVGECKEIERLFKKSINKNRSQLSKKQLEDLKDDNYHIYVVNFHQCPVCREWEDHKDFALDYNLNLFKCNQWGDCDEYDDYYKDESNG
jgi:hypothetical protein